MTSTRNKSKSIIILIVIMLVLTGFRLLWAEYHIPSEKPAVEKGVLDLREYNVKSESPVSFEGGWVFFPGTLAQNPQELPFDAGTHSDNTAKESSEDSSTKFGTYHLKILIDKTIDSEQSFSLSIPSTDTASSLFVNGDLKGYSGHAAKETDQHLGKGNPYTVTFTSEKQKIDIMLQVSNFDTPGGAAVSSPITFGAAEQVTQDRNFEHTLLISLVVILLLHSIYSLLIYLFVSRTKIMLFFAVGFVFPAVDELLTYNSSFMEWLHFNFEWSFKFKEFIYLGAAFFLVQIMRNLLKNAQKYKRFRWFTMLYGFCTLLIFILPLDYLTRVNSLFFILYFVSFIGVVPLALKDYFQYKDESIFIAIVVVSTTSGILWGFIKEVTGINIPFYPFDYLCAFFSFAIFWFKRFYRQNQQVVELVEELEQADKKKDEFLANTSHELRNPLHGVINIAQTILEDNQEPLTNRSKEKLELLVNVGRRMTHTLNDLMDVTRLQEQRIRLYKKNIDLHPVAVGVIDMIRFMTAEKDLRLSINIPETFPMVEADEDRVVQILFNLLHNAVKFTEKGTVIIEAEHHYGKAAISITDTGVGMSEDLQDRIFKAYEQVDANAAENGIGLGLTVCKQLVELHGGDITVSSVVGEGSVVTFTLPLAEDAPNEREDSQEVAVTKEEKIESFHPSLPLIKANVGDQTENKGKILAVEDDPVNLNILEMILAAEYEVTAAKSGQEALEMIDTQDWDLVVTDVIMPRMSGYELTKRIRKQFKISELPILLLTARNQQEDIYTGFDAGANDYIAKPVDAKELKVRVEALVKLKQSIREQLRVEAAWLQAQIQPHFLFNTLNTIVSLSEVDTDRMVTLISEFGNYLQRSFHIHNTESLVSLDVEFKLINSYLYIEKERFGERLQVKWDIEDGLNITVPPLSIQTLIENAVRHGILQRVGGGTVCIKAVEHQNDYEIAVIDDGAGMDNQAAQQMLNIHSNRQSVGIPNTNKRLKELYGKGLDIESMPGKGTTVTFKIPK
ncbi:ATP-binding protein [Salibacterium lacus]|uniref:histidine kinase n=1 Tax=Salibacterium lacus TaxID=1898109 RepID=A0ABW5T4K4_9BACI